MVVKAGLLKVVQHFRLSILLIQQQSGDILLTGHLYKTTDFGDSWNALNVGLGYGNGAFFIDEYTGWVGGTSGTMFNYSVEP